MEKLASSIVRDGPLPAEDAVGWVYRLATTLEVLHLAGRAHGRISAKAIDLLSRQCDGGAFFLDAYELPDDPCYQSPERLAGGEACPADDVWAIGVLLFFALTGELPFPGPNAIEVSAALVANDPPKLASFGVADPRLQRLVDQLLAIDPDERLQSVHPLLSVLVEWYEFTAELQPLKLGKPALALFDETTDDDGQKLTAVLKGDDPVLLKVRRDYAGLAAGSAGAPPGPLAKADREQPKVESAAQNHLSVGDRPVTEARAAEAPAVGASPALPAQPSVAPAGADSGDSLRTRHYLLALLFVVLGGVAGFLWFSGYFSSLQGGAARPGAPEESGGLPRQDAAAGATSDATEAPASDRDGGGQLASAGDAEAAQSGADSDAAATPAPDASAATATPASVGADGGAPSSTGRAALQELARCLAELFPPDAWSPAAPPDLSFVCSEANPIKGARRLHVALTAAGAARPHPTRAMHEWALLTWYDKPVFALAHSRCCERPTPLVTKPSSGRCAFDEALTGLIAAARATDPSSLEAARKRYDETAACLLRMGLASAFGHTTLPASGSFTVFQGIAQRARRPRGEKTP